MFNHFVSEFITEVQLSINSRCLIVHGMVNNKRIPKSGGERCKPDELPPTPLSHLNTKHLISSLCAPSQSGDP
uniref:Uncharacterized protein n=1 Tax=Megaselia scalaris TaxID=36166 RepID=T1GLD2_MEGSC